MDAEVSPEKARQILSMLTDGGSLGHINTSLALRLMPLAKELGRAELVEKLLDHATSVAANAVERGWARFEGLKLMEANVDSFLLLAEDAETIDEGTALNAALHHYIALLYLSQGRYDEAKATAVHALRLRSESEDLTGKVYGLALLMSIAKRQHDEDTAIAYGTERLELVTQLNDDEGIMEVLAELAHCQATIGELAAAHELYTQSLERAKELASISGQLVARWGLADLSEIQQDYETAMLSLSDALHEYIALDLPAPAPLRQRIHDLTNLMNQPQDDSQA